MSSRYNRDRVRDPREEILLETNFDNDGVLTRAYNNHQPNRRRSTYRSDHSLDRYSDHTLHGIDRKGDCCQSFMTRIPYMTLVATVMCLLGVGIFSATLYRGASLTNIMMDQVFHVRLMWIEAVQITFVIIGATMAALGFMILFIGFLATGATRRKVFRSGRIRVIGGRVACAVLMGITLVLNLVWMLMFAFLIIVTFIYTVFWYMCTSIEQSLSCIDLTQFKFMFPSSVKIEDLKICEKYQVKAFCKDGVENAEVMFILATVASLLVILSLINYLMCLAANYAHIRDLGKFSELQDLQNLNELEYSATSKDRF